MNLKPLTVVALTSVFAAVGVSASPSDTRPTLPPVAQCCVDLKDHIVYFDFDQSTLTPDGLSVVQEASKYALDYRATREVIVAHADTSGSAAYNMRLSERRSKAVAEAMVAFGVPAASLDVRWKGKSDPAVQTGDGVREPLNRRAKIDVLF
jgi:OOP family OmpA-OmpF porin